MKKLLLIIVCGLINVHLVSAQIFSQDFSSSTSTAAYVNAGNPTLNQFTFISNYGNTLSTIVDGKLQYVKTAASTSHFVRNFDFVPTPTFMLVKFKFEASAAIGNAALNHAALMVGTGFTNDGNLPANTNSKFGITMDGNRFKLNVITNAANTTISETSAYFTGQQNISFAINNTGAAQSYLAPNGALETLANDTWDLWVGDTKVYNDVSATDGNVDLKNFRFSMLSATTTINTVKIQFDDIQVFNQSVLPLIVTFNGNNGTETAPIGALANQPIAKPADPVRSGYTFAGWYKDAALTTPWNFTTDIVTQATTLHAKWDELTYAVTFESNGGSNVSTKNSKYNQLVVAPTAPTRSGYIFAGWFKDPALTAPWDFATDVLLGNITLYAKWNDPSQRITFVTIPNKVYGDLPFDLVATATSGLPVTFEALTPNLTIVNNTVTIVGIGTARVRALQNGNANYIPATPVELSFEIAKAQQTITFAQAGPFSRYIGTVNLVATSSAGLPISFSGSEPTVAQLNGAQLAVKGLGKINVTASQPGNEFYLAAEPITREITIHTAGSVQLLISKALSPNNDGVNDLLIIEGIKSYPENRVKIVNRDGLAVFNKDQYDNESIVFNGTREGGDRLAVGTYYYFISIKQGSEWVQKTGYFVLRY